MADTMIRTEAETAAALAHLAKMAGTTRPKFLRRLTVEAGTEVAQRIAGEVRAAVAQAAREMAGPEVSR